MLSFLQCTAVKQKVRKLVGCRYTFRIQFHKMLSWHTKAAEVISAVLSSSNVVCLSLSCASRAVCGFVVYCLTEISKLEAVNSEGWTEVVNFLR